VRTKPCSQLLPGGLHSVLVCLGAGVASPVHMQRLCLLEWGNIAAPSATHARTRARTHAQRTAPTPPRTQIELEGIPKDDPSWPSFDQMKGLLRSKPGHPISTKDIEADCVTLLSTGESPQGGEDGGG